MSAGVDGETLQRIVDAIDRVYEELFQKGDLGFVSTAEQKAFYFGWHRRGDRRRWEAAHVCMYPSCSKRAVPRSHTLPRSGPLERLAEHGHVVTPTFDRSRGNLTAGRIGIRDASTFPGFCEAHETMFQTFEQRKELSAERDHVLQFFRLVCREIRVRELEMEKLRGMAAAHLELVERRGTQRIRELLGAEFLKNHKLGSVQFKDFDSRHAMMMDRVRDMEARLASYNSDFFAPLHADIEGIPGEELTIFTFSTEVEFPVCLGGRGNFLCQTHDGVTRETIVFGYVWPSASGTTVAFLARNDRHDDLSAYLDEFLGRPLGLLTLIESWMAHGTDHWFIRPSTWNVIPRARQDQILADILDESRNIASEYPYSIFDELRTQATNTFEPNNDLETALFERELAKLRARAPDSALRLIEAE